MGKRIIGYIIIPSYPGRWSWVQLLYPRKENDELKSWGTDRLGLVFLPVPKGLRKWDPSVFSFTCMVVVLVGLRGSNLMSRFMNRDLRSSTFPMINDDDLIVIYVKGGTDDDNGRVSLWYKVLPICGRCRRDPTSHSHSGLARTVVLN